VKTSTKDVLAQDIIDGLRKRIAELEAGSDRTGKHYGLYGTACLYTGQLDAGPCWKCQIKKLEAKLDAVVKLRDEAIEAENQLGEDYGNVWHEELTKALQQEVSDENDI